MIEKQVYKDGSTCIERVIDRQNGFLEYNMYVLSNLNISVIELALIITLIKTK